jgi:hypothetical protein
MKVTRLKQEIKFMTPSIRVTAYGFASIVAGGVMLIAGVTAWNGSTSAGGDQEGKARAIVADVASVTKMTPMCEVIGRSLAEAGIRARISARRPTHSIWTEREDRASSAWAAARCPDAALLGITFGIADIANFDERKRFSEARG